MRSDVLSSLQTQKLLENTPYFCCSCTVCDIQFFLLLFFLPDVNCSTARKKLFSNVPLPGKSSLKAEKTSAVELSRILIFLHTYLYFFYVSLSHRENRFKSFSLFYKLRDMAFVFMRFPKARSSTINVFGYFPSLLTELRNAMNSTNESWQTFMDNQN